MISIMFVSQNKSTKKCIYSDSKSFYHADENLLNEIISKHIKETIVVLSERLPNYRVLAVISCELPTK